MSVPPFHLHGVSSSRNDAAWLQGAAPSQVVVQAGWVIQVKAGYTEMILGFISIDCPDIPFFS